MKLGAAVTLIGLGAGIATFAVTQGCGDSASDTGTLGRQTGKTVPPEEGSPTSSTEERVFAVNSISLGEADTLIIDFGELRSIESDELSGELTLVIDCPWRLDGADAAARAGWPYLSALVRRGARR